MKSIFKLFIYFIVFILSVMIFLPKESIYNFVEKELVKKNIIISNEKRSEKYFSFKITDAKVYYEGIEVANIDRSTFSSYLFYTSIKAKNIRLLDSFESMFPTPITNIEIKHSILNYDKLDIKANGIFGELVGNIDIINRLVILELNASNKMKSSYSKILRNMKLKDGRYIYEYRF